MNNPEIRDVLDTVTRKVVLLLGRFKPERKAVLDALKVELRSRNLVPVIFDFDQAEARDITETITLLARISRFVIADLTAFKYPSRAASYCARCSSAHSANYSRAARALCHGKRFKKIPLGDKTL